MFLHLSVSHSVHGGWSVCPSACWDTPHRTRRQTPPRSRGRHPPDRHPLELEADFPPGRHPPGPEVAHWAYTPPGTGGRHQPGTRGRHYPGRHPPGTRGRHPHPLGPEADTPPGRNPPQQTATVADGTHLTGMHTCCHCIQTIQQNIFRDASVQSQCNCMFCDSCKSSYEKKSTLQ